MSKTHKKKYLTRRSEYAILATERRDTSKERRKVMEDRIKEVLRHLRGGTLIDADVIKPHLGKSVTKTNIRIALIRMGIFMKRVKGRRVPQEQPQEHGA